jgi:hypothetical protein
MRVALNSTPFTWALIGHLEALHGEVRMLQLVMLRGEELRILQRGLAHLDLLLQALEIEQGDLQQFEIGLHHTAALQVGGVVVDGALHGLAGTRQLHFRDAAEIDVDRRVLIADRTLLRACVM